MEYQVFNTGDQLWTSQRFGKRVAVKVITHDGIVWEEEGGTRRLTGAELAFHRVQVFLMRLILKATLA